MSTHLRVNESAMSPRRPIFAPSLMRERDVGQGDERRPPPSQSIHHITATMARPLVSVVNNAGEAVGQVRCRRGRT